MYTYVFVLPPAHGHVNPVLGVMAELLARGERVIAYNIEPFRAKIESCGAEFRSYPETAMSTAEISHLLVDGNLANITKLLLDVSAELIPATAELLRRDQADIAVLDSLAVWGKTAAAQLDMPTVGSITHFVMDESEVGLWDLVRLMWRYVPQVPGIFKARRALANEYGDAFPGSGPLFPIRGECNLIFTTPDLQPPTDLVDDSFRFVGPSTRPSASDAAPNFPFEQLDARPLVYISLGTVHTERLAFFQTCFEAFGAYPAQFVLSVGNEANLRDLGRVPDNFIVQASVPQVAILARATAFISHAGMNSLHESLLAGVPMVLLPQQAEQLMNARIVAERGAGVLLPNHINHKRISAEALRTALDEVMNGERFRVSAEGLQQTLQATGGARQAANVLQAFVREKITVA